MAFHLGQIEEASVLVRRWHYSHHVPANLQLVGSWHLPGGLFGDTGPMVAACFFSVPATRWGEPVLELSRLVRVEGTALPPLSGLISRTVKAVKRKALTDLLVSFADWTHRHHGGVYQAASWRFNGLREPRMDAVIVGGRVYQGRVANHLWGTRSPQRLAAKGIVAEGHMDEGKYLYWLPLNKAGEAKAERLGLHGLPYPKPAREYAPPRTGA